MRKWLQQPHFDMSAIHPFYGSKRNYVVLVGCSILLIICAFTLAQDIHSFFKSYSSPAKVIAVYKNAHSEAYAHLRLIDHQNNIHELHLPAVMIEREENASIDDLLEIPVRYQLKDGQLQLLYPQSSQMHLLRLSLQSVLLGLLLYFLRYLSPYPAWYWRRAESYFQELAANSLKIEVRLQSLSEIKACPHTGQRLCQIDANIFLPNVQRFIHFQSPQFLVESKFYMSYPFVTIYIDFNDMNNYEVDLVSFLKNNASVMHGFKEAQRMQPDIIERYCKVG